MLNFFIPARWEAIMSDGGLGNGLDYWATIKIHGTINKAQLKAVTKALRDVLAGNVTTDNPPVVKRQSDQSDDGIAIEGQIVQAARTANTTPPSISVTLNEVKKKS
jgi:hypothetical protein